MEYVVISSSDQVREQWQHRLGEHGFVVREDYDPDATLLTLGGDGTILFAARTYRDPTILPVRTAGSAGNRTTLHDEDVIDTLEHIERGSPDSEYAIDRHRKLAAFRNGTELRGDFDALNEISLHHRSPVHAAIFATRVRDGQETQTFPRVVGDGVLVATPFGSTGYYRSITRSTFDAGIGIAFNNVHDPTDTPDSLVVSDDAVIEVELLEAEHGSGAVLTRDDDHDTYDLPVGTPIEIRLTERVVELLRPFTD